MFRLFIFSCVFILNLYPVFIAGQNLDVSLTISPNPPENPFIWDAQNPSVFQIDIFNNENNPLQVIVVAQIVNLDQGGPVGQSDPASSPIINLPPNQSTILNGPQAVSISSMNFFDPNVVSNQALPPGNYEFCIDIIDTQNEFPIAVQICQLFVIESQFINIDCQLGVNRDISADFSNWDALVDQFTLELNNNTFLSYEVIAVANLNGENGLVAQTNPFMANPILVQNGNNMFSGSQAFPVMNMDILDGSLLVSGILNSGTYELCVDIVEASNESNIICQVCEQFSIITDIVDPTEFDDFICPTNVLPLDGASFSDDDIVNTVFQWFPATDLSNGNYQYKFLLFEIIDGQSIGEAFQNNQFIIEEILDISDNIFEWPADFITPFCNQMYGWTVTIIDEFNGNTSFCGPQGISTFTYFCDSILNPFLDSMFITTFEKTCLLTTELKSGVQMDGGLVLGTDAKKIGVTNVYKTELNANKPLPLKAIGADYDLLNIFCAPDPFCQETPSKRSEILTGRVKFEWKVINGPAEFVTVSCGKGSNIAFGDNVFLQVNIPKDSASIVIDVELSVIDDISGQPIDGKVVRPIEIDVRKSKSKGYLTYDIWSEKFKVPFPINMSDQIGTCKAEPPIWKAPNDLSEPSFKINGDPKISTVVSGQAFTITVNDMRDKDIVLLGCKSLQCSSMGNELGFEDNVQYDWKLTYKERTVGNNGDFVKGEIGFVSGLNASIRDYALIEKEKGAQVLLYIPKLNEIMFKEGEIEIQATVSNPGGGQLGDAAKSFTKKIKVVNRHPDLDIDSKNQKYIYDLPDRNETVDEIEEDEGLSGKYIPVNDGDKDDDGIPDYADFSEGPNMDKFARIILEIPKNAPLNQEILSFEYSGSDPSWIDEITIEDDKKTLSQNGKSR